MRMEKNILGLYELYFVFIGSPVSLVDLLINNILDKKNWDRKILPRIP